jgi:hypothetical protein
VKRHLSILMTGLALSVAVLLPAAHAATATAKLVYVITNRGCEEVCRSFQHGLENQGPVTFVLRDADGDAARVPAFIEEAHRLHADLIATWGTGITLAVVGPYGGGRHVRRVRYIRYIWRVRRTRRIQRDGYIQRVCERYSGRLHVRRQSGRIEDRA